MAQNTNDNATTTVTVNGEEAKRELTALAQRAETLRQKLKEANDAGDEKAFSKLGKQLKATQKEMKQLERDSFDLKKVLNNLSGASIGELTRAKRELDKQFSSPALQRNSKEWKQVRDDLRSVKKEISSLNSETAVGESRISKFANGFNKYFAGITAFIAGLTGITLGLKKFMDLRNEVEDSKANLAALTGLGDDDIQWLRDYAKELSTTTTEAGVRITASAKEIMDGFTTIGSKRPELLKNKEAMASVTKEALTLAAAGKMDVATAFDVVTASMNQFNLGAAEAGRIINVIAAGSLEGSAEADSLAGSLKNVGTVADGSNMTLEDTIALLEVLASKQLLGEEAGTKLRGAILRLKDAGLGYTSGAFNMRDALVELNAELDKKANAAEKDAKMQKIFGAENITAGQILLTNIDAYDKLRVAVSGTNTAYDQAIIQTSTVSARMAQAKNEFNEAGMALVENLNPAILKLTSFSTNFLKILVQMPRWLNENKGLLLTLSITMLAYAIAVERARIASLAQLAIEKAKIIWTKASTAATLLQIAVTGYLTGGVRAANLATKAFFTTLGLNPFVAIALLIAAATIAIYKWVAANNQASESQKIFNDRLKEQKELTLEYSKNVMQEKTNLEGLVGAIMLVNNNSDLRLSMIKKLKEQYPGFLSYLSAEKITNEMLRGALMEVNEQYSIRIRNAALMGKAESFESAAVKAEQRRIEIAEEINRLSKQNSDGSRKRISELNEEDRQLQRNIKAYQQKSSTYRTEANLNDAEIKKMNTVEYAQSQLVVWYKAAEDFERKFKEARDSGLTDQADYYQKQLTEANSYVKFYIAKRAELRKAEEQKPKTETPTVKPSGENLTEKEREKAYKKAEDDLANTAKRRQLILDEMYRTKQINELLYTKLSEANEMMSLEEKLKLQKKFGKETIDTEVAISAAKLKQQKTDLKQIEDYKNAIDALNKMSVPVEEEFDDTEIVEFKNKYDSFLKIQEKYGLNELTEFEKTKKLELEILQDFLRRGLLSERDAARVRALLDSEEFNIKTQNLKDYANTVNNVSADMLNAVSGFQAAEEKRVEIKYQKQIYAAEKAGKDTTQLEEQKNQELAEIRAKAADEIFALQVASIIATTAMSAMDAYSSALKIPIAGPVLAPMAAAAAITFGASQLAQASAARDEAKAGYYDGGYTGGKDPREVRGYFPDGSPYHGMEYVADHRTTGNQAFRKVFDLAEYAKKTNRIASITTSDIANALGMKAGYYAGGYKLTDYAAGSSTPDAYINSELTAALRESNAVNAALLAEIQRGITSKTHIHGDGGIEKAQETYNKLIKNARG